MEYVCSDWKVLILERKMKQKDWNYEQRMSGIKNLPSSQIQISTQLIILNVSGFNSRNVVYWNWCNIEKNEIVYYLLITIHERG